MTVNTHNYGVTVVPEATAVGEDGLPLAPIPVTEVQPAPSFIAETPIPDPVPPVSPIGAQSNEVQTTAVGEDGLPLAPTPPTPVPLSPEPTPPVSEGGTTPVPLSPEPAPPISEGGTTPTPPPEPSAVLDSLLFGTEAGETLTGTDKTSVTFAQGGNDIINVAGATTVFAGEGDDQINGGAAADLLSGDVGGDTLKGGDGNDILLGGAGNDVIDGGKGTDLLIGGEGDDRLIWNNGDGSDFLNGGAGTDVAEINGAADKGNVFTLTADGNQASFQRTNLKEFTKTADSVEQFAVNGGSGNDRFTVDDMTSAGVGQVSFAGGNGQDVFDGSRSAAALIGNGDAGNDFLTGGSAADVFNGGAGTDFLTGGLGADQLTGGEGSDVFVLQAPGEDKAFDAIADFDAIEDTFFVSKALIGDLESAIGAPITGAQFRIGESATEGGAQFVYNNQSGGLFYDSDGAGGSDQVQLATLGAGLELTNNNFVVV